MPLSDETRRKGAEEVKKKLTGSKKTPKGYAKVRKSGGHPKGWVTLSLNVPSEHHKHFPEGSIMKVTRDNNRLIYELVEQTQAEPQEPPLINPNWNKQ